MNDMTLPVQVHGTVAPGLEKLRAAFAANFARNDDYRENGATLAVYHHGRRVAHLWAGHADRAQQKPWNADSLINVYSATKGVVAIGVAKLVEDGKLRYEDKVTRWWPEFAAGGKQDMTVAQLLSHQAGLTGFMTPTSVDDLYDWNACCHKLAAQTPFWAPGTQTSYHAMTWGFLAGELVRRVSGVSAGRYVREAITTPLGADVYVGLSQELEPRVAELLAPRSAPDLSALTQPPQALAALVNPQLDPEIPNQRAWRAAEIPAANGQATADGLARCYAMLANGGELDGRRLLSGATLRAMTAIQSTRTDLLIGLTGNWSMGMSRNQMGMLGPRAETFGHTGWGGSFGCADVESGVAIGYVCNQMGAQMVGDPRAAGLCAAVFEALK